MKIRRRFSATARKGKMVTKARQLVPLPVAVHSAKMTIDEAEADDEVKEISIEIGGTVAFTGSAKANEALVFDPPLKINMGYPSITVSASPYLDGFRIEGSVDLNISIGGKHK